MTQLELGEASSKMINTISNIERGLVDVKITTLNDIAKALGMPLDEFVANENPVIRDENRTLYRETIHTIRKLNPEDMKKMLDIIKLFIKHSKHTKPVDYLSSIRI
ncbi:MAG: helix-turn-helix transcriptional regulator [Alphaproteobacteria bacterium]|nr:helix-turn-helix transcriptional regulator [Alphaproteobacteria bacterium]